MYAIEFETDIKGGTLIIPNEVKDKIGQQCKHVRIIMLMDEDNISSSQTADFQRASVEKIYLPPRDSLHER